MIAKTQRKEQKKYRFATSKRGRPGRRVPVRTVQNSAHTHTKEMNMKVTKERDLECRNIVEMMDSSDKCLIPHTNLRNSHVILSINPQPQKPNPEKINTPYSDLNNQSRSPLLMPAPTYR